jgi:hypothetical protein
MSLKFVAIGNLMALSALESHALVQDRFNTGTFAPVEAYDPLLALIGQGRRVAEAKAPMTPEATEHAAAYARW